VAGDVEVRTQVLQARLGQLVELFDDTDRLKGQIQSLRENQGGDVWPDIPSVQEFATAFRDALRAREDRLESIRTAIDACRQALADSALSLEQQDAAVQEQLRLLAQRLDAAPASSAATSSGAPNVTRSF
jgi:DNA repair exonuclease SbcCD ATPase subunit